MPDKEKGKKILETTFGLYGGNIGGAVCGVGAGGKAGKKICGAVGKELGYKVADVVVDTFNKKVNEIGNRTGRMLTSEAGMVFLQLGIVFCQFLKQMCCSC